MRAEDRGSGAGSPATVAPPRQARLISCSTVVPPNRVESLSWLPPVMKMPVACAKTVCPLGLIRMVAIMHEGDVGGAGAEFEKDSLVSLTCGFDRTTQSG